MPTKIPAPMTSTIIRAPGPKTVSPAAQEALRCLCDAPEPEDLEVNRGLCEAVQRDLGALQLERHGVRMQEATIGGVPARIFTPPSLPDRNRGCVLLNLHGGGFTVDAGSVTENVPVAAYARMTVVAARYRLAPEHSFPAAVDDAEAVHRGDPRFHAEPNGIVPPGTAARRRRRPPSGIRSHATRTLDLPRPSGVRPGIPGNGGVLRSADRRGRSLECLAARCIQVWRITSSVGTLAEVGLAPSNI